MLQIFFLSSRLSSFWLAGTLDSLSRSYCSKKKHTNGIFLQMWQRICMVKWTCITCIRCGIFYEIIQLHFSVQYNNYKIKQNYIRPPSKHAYHRKCAIHFVRGTKKCVRNKDIKEIVKHKHCQVYAACKWLKKFLLCEHFNWCSSQSLPNVIIIFLLYINFSHLSNE